MPTSEVAGIGNEKGTPLWRSMTKGGTVTPNRMNRVDVFRMVKRRVRQAELGVAANCHTFRATDITAYLLNGGSVENAQAIAAHESPRTTKLYDRTADEISLDEIEKIVIEGEEFRALYNQHWLIERLGFQPPVQARQRLALQPAA